MAPTLVEKYAPSVDRFMDAIRTDWQLTEAMAVRANTIIASRTLKEATPTR